MLWQVTHGAAGAELRDAMGHLVLQGTLTADVPLVLQSPAAARSGLTGSRSTGCCAFTCPPKC
ncbi:hypothetical protein [Rhodobacter capsulatus]|uniref:hypothetical protein n=1 Tax=Rhodobacter capsulatus TaxID=1061 RepID=UPI00402875D1